MNVAARTQSPGRAAGHRQKYTPVNRSAARSAIRPKLAWFLTVLEDLSMDRTPDLETRWGIVYDADLRPMFGSDDTIGRLWQEAESQGFLLRVRTPKGARIGFVWLRRMTGRPVATAETLDLVVAELEAAVAGRKSRARTIPMGLPDPCTYRRIAGAPTAELRVHLPQNCGGSAAAPYSDPARIGSQTDTEKTTTTRPVSSSSLDASTQMREPERPPDVEPPSPVPAQPIPADASTHSVAGDPAPVPELPAELVARGAETVPDASRQWLAELLRDCAQWGLELALLVLAWVVVQRARKPMRYAKTALAGWLDQLRAGTIDLAGIRQEVYGRPAVVKPFDPAAILARMKAHHWTLEVLDDGTVKWMDGESACVWKGIPSDLRGLIGQHKPELKAYVLAQAGKGVLHADP